MNTNHIATNIGNALYLGCPYKIPPMTVREMREVMGILKRDGISRFDVMKVEGWAL